MIGTDKEKLSPVIQLETALMKKHRPNYFFSFVKFLFAASQRAELRKPRFPGRSGENPDSRAVVDGQIFTEAILRVSTLDAMFFFQPLVKI